MSEQSIRRVRRALGPPDAQVGRAVFYQVDAISALNLLPAGCIDLAVTSPPYNIGKEYEEVEPLQSYIAWCRTWMTSVSRVLSDSGAFWLNLGYTTQSEHGHAIPLPYLLFPFHPFYLNQEVVWHYEAGVSSRRYLSPRNEKWLWLVKDPAQYVFNLDSIRDPNVKYPNQKKNGKLRVNPLGKNPGDVWVIPKVTTGENMDGRRASVERTAHPAQFPERVVERILLASSSHDAMVLDPFGGSGTTAVVAERLGRSSVYFDLNDRYLQMAIDRASGKPKKQIQDPRVLPLLRPLDAAGNE